MKRHTPQTIDAVVIFLGGAITAQQLNQPEPPLVEEAVMDQFIEDHGQDKEISVVHLAELYSEITLRQISELNRLHQRHDHLVVVAALNNEPKFKEPCQQLKNDSEVRYHCVAAPELHKYDNFVSGHFTQTSNLYLHIKGDGSRTEQKIFLHGYQDYQELIQILGLDY